MTTEMLVKLFEYRALGMGYKSIANELGISRDQVRYACKIHNLRGHKKAVFDGKICPQCGRDIIQPEGRGRKKRFCCTECRMLWWGRNQKALKSRKESFQNLKCAYCGKEFRIYGHKNQKYCSMDCYRMARYWS